MDSGEFSSTTEQVQDCNELVYPIIMSTYQHTVFIDRKKNVDSEFLCDGVNENSSNILRSPRRTQLPDLPLATRANAIKWVE